MKHNPIDGWVLGLYSDYGLGENPSLKQIKEKALELLQSPRTKQTAAELVLGRRVDGDRMKEPDVSRILFDSGIDAEERLRLLLMEREIQASIRNN